MQLEHQQRRRRRSSNECQLVEPRLWHCNASCELAEAPAGERRLAFKSSQANSKLNLG